MPTVSHRRDYFRDAALLRGRLPSPPPMMRRSTRSRFYRNRVAASPPLRRLGNVTRRRAHSPLPSLFAMTPMPRFWHDAPSTDAAINRDAHGRIPRALGRLYAKLSAAGHAAADASVDVESASATPDRRLVISAAGRSLSLACSVCRHADFYYAP